MAKREELTLDVKVKGTKDVDALAKSFDEVESASKKAASASKQAASALVADWDKVGAQAKETAAIMKTLGDALGADAGKFDLERVANELQKAGVDAKGAAENVEMLADGLRRLESTKAGITDLGTGMGTVKTKTDDLTRSVGGSRSVLANMVGNATQDLGALAGVAGSAGVAIGQMGEYMADARLEGEGMGSVLKNFVGIAAPVLGLSAAIGIATKVWGDYQRRQKEIAENTRETVEAMAEITDAAKELDGVLEDLGETGDDFGDILLASLGPDKIGDALTAAHELGIEITDLGDIISGLGEKGATGGFEKLVQSIMENTGVIREDAIDLADAAVQAGDNWGVFYDLALRNTDLTVDQIDALEHMFRLYGDIGQVAKDTDINKVAQEQLDLLDNTVEGLEQILAARDRLAGRGLLDPSAIQIATEVYAANQDVVRSIDEVNAALRSQRNATQAAEQNWKVLLRDLEDGAINTTFAAIAQRNLQTQLGLSNDEMDALIAQKLDEHMLDIAAAEEEAALAMREANEAAKEASIELMSAASRAEAFAAAMARSATTLGGIQTDQLVDFVDNMRGVGDALGEAAAAGVDFAQVDIIPDTWEEVLAMPDELRPVVEAFGQFRESIGTEMGEAFAAGGAPAVRAWAVDTRTAVIDEIKAMGLGVEEEAALIEQSLTELGLTDVQIEATIKLAGEEQARAALEIFASDIEALPEGVEFEVRTLMANGQFIEALELMNAARIEQGQSPIVIPGVVDTAQADADVKAFRAKEESEELPVTLKTNADDAKGDIDDATEDRTTQVIVPKSDSLGQMQDLIDHVARARTVAFNSKADNAGQIDAILDAVAGRRDAPIYVVLPNIVDANRQLNQIAQQRNATIVVRTVGGGGGGGAAPTAGGLAAPMAAGPMAMTAAEEGVGIATLDAPAPPALVSSSPAIPLYPLASPVTNNNYVTVQAAVIGNRHEVERTVAKALRSYTRLNGRRN